MIEARSPAGAFYPPAEKVASFPASSPDALLHRLHRDLLEHTGEQLTDDAAFLIIERTPLRHLHRPHLMSHAGGLPCDKSCWMLARMAQAPVAGEPSRQQPRDVADYDTAPFASAQGKDLINRGCTTLVLHVACMDSSCIRTVIALSRTFDHGVGTLRLANSEERRRLHPWGPRSRRGRACRHTIDRRSGRRAPASPRPRLDTSTE